MEGSHWDGELPGFLLLLHSFSEHLQERSEPCQALAAQGLRLIQGGQGVPAQPLLMLGGSDITLDKSRVC